MVGVHVGVDLEDEARHFGFRRLHDAGFGRGRGTARGYAHEAFEQLAHAEVVDRRTEEYRGQFAPQIKRHGRNRRKRPRPDRRPSAIWAANLSPIWASKSKRRGPRFRRSRRRPWSLVGGEEREVFLVEVVYALERGAVRDRERQRPHADVEPFRPRPAGRTAPLRGAVGLLLMKTITGVERMRQTSISLARLRLDALGAAVDDDDDRIDGRQRAEGVLGEVFVARSVENVDLRALVFGSPSRPWRPRFPRWRSISMKSEVAPFLILLLLTAPATWMAPPKRSSFSVRVVFTRVGVGDDREGAAACDLFPVMSCN